MSLSVFTIPLLSDNYGFLLRDEASGEVAAVDPSEADPILRFCDEKRWKIAKIINTHHHWDHVGGNEKLVAKYRCPVICSKHDSARVPGATEFVDETSTISVGATQGKVLSLPGHTLGHIALWFSEAKALFCGDTLFGLGCGRLFEGSAQQMFTSLQRICELPDETKIYCGHEYTVANLRFAVSLGRNAEALRKYQAEVQGLRDKKLPSVPSLLSVEKQLNPFLNTESVAEFAALRTAKDGWS